MTVKTHGIDNQIVDANAESLKASLKVTANIIVKNGMATGAAAITLGHILKLYKADILKKPKEEMAVLTNIQKFDKLAEEATGFAHSTLQRYMQLASAFLIKKQHIQTMIEDNVKGMGVNLESVEKIAKAIGQDLEVTALYKQYGILPDNKTKTGGSNTTKSVKEVIVDQLQTLVAWFGEKAVAEGYDPNVILTIQEEIMEVQLNAEASLAAEEGKAKVAKENLKKIVTKKQPKIARELSKVMELHEAEMKAPQGVTAQKTTDITA